MSTKRFSLKTATAANMTPEQAERIMELAADYLLSKTVGNDALTSPEATREFLRLKLGAREHEVFGAIWLTNRHHVIAFDEMFRGTIDASSVHPREVVKDALKHNAAAVIFSHNHPSGIAEPSQADLRLTQRLKDALGLVDVRVLDHVIVSPSGYCSFAENGLI